MMQDEDNFFISTKGFELGTTVRAAPSVHAQFQIRVGDYIVSLVNGEGTYARPWSMRMEMGEGCHMAIDEFGENKHHVTTYARSPQIEMAVLNPGGGFVDLNDGDPIEGNMTVERLIDFLHHLRHGGEPQDFFREEES